MGIDCRRIRNLSLLALTLALLTLLMRPSLITRSVQAGGAPSGKSKEKRKQDAPGLDRKQIAALKSLYARVGSGHAFSSEEILVLTKFNRGETVSALEADAVISRILYKAYVERDESSLNPKQRDLLGRYRQFASARGVAIADVKAMAERSAATRLPVPSFAPQVAPANDTCAGAEVIPGSGPFPVLTSIVDITDATSAGDPAFTCQASTSRGVWFSFTPDRTTTYTITTCPSLAPGTTLPDTVLAVYTSSGGCAGPFTSIGCNDDDSGCQSQSLASRLSLRLTGNTQYFILVAKSGALAPAAGAASVQLWVAQQPPPLNDTCDTPGSISLDIPVSGTLLTLADDYELSGSACFGGVGQTSSAAVGRDAVYSFTAPSDDTYSFRAQDIETGGDLVLYVADNCPAATPGAPVTVTGCLGAANRNSNSAAYAATEEVFCLSLAADQTVFIFVDEDSAATTGGGFTLEVHRCANEVEPNDTPATASGLACGTEGSISSAGDVDFYSLGTPDVDSRVFAAVFALASNSADFQLRVTTTTDTLEFDDNDGDANVLGDLAPVVGGTPLTGVDSFLRVNHSAVASEPYSLYAVVQPSSSVASTETEPNNSTGQANGPANGYFSGALSGPSPSADVDVFKFSASGGDLIFLGLDGDPLRDNTPLNAKLELLDSSGVVLRVANDGDASSSTSSGGGSLTSATPFSPAEAIVFSASTAGTYYARVSAGSTSATTAAGDYLLSISINCQAAVAVPPPDCVLTCSPNVSVPSDPGQCGAVVTFDDPTPTGTCGDLMCAPAAGSFFPTGVTTVTCTSTAGDPLPCSFTVTVIDSQAPQITCAGDITVTSSGACQVVTFATPVATDDCPTTVICSPPSGSCLPVGSTTVTCTATDSSGNSASCSFGVSVFDICLQDDSRSSTVLLISSLTGDYRFCCGGATFSGVGTVQKAGNVITLQHYTTDRRVLAKVDTGTKSGTASLQSPPGRTICTIRDRNTANNTCVCK